jgi:lipoate---protein ligase
METRAGIVKRAFQQLCWLNPGDIDEPDEQHMEAESHLLRAVELGLQPPTVRCYTWRRPAVTIGRLQSEAAARAAFPGMPLYRRPTGGRGVLHGGDLTICVAAPNSVFGPHHARGIGVMAAYHALTAPVNHSLSKFGVAIKTGNGSYRKSRTIAREDCFSSTAPCDVVDEKHGIKVLGCALRRSAGAVLLQMSLRPMPGIDIFSLEFLDELRRQYERCLNIGIWDVAERRN